LTYKKAGIIYKGDLAIKRQPFGCLFFWPEITIRYPVVQNYKIISGPLATKNKNSRLKLRNIEKIYDPLFTATA